MKKMLSGIKPTGRLHLGNYIGAIRQFIQFQDEYELYVFIANLHAITVRIEKNELKRNTKELIGLYLACGLNPEKVHLFLQSDVIAHTQLGWILTCNSYLGELNRMTQFKDKLSKKEDNLTGGLYTYPSLMAADILLYDADFVPVGVDQKQHVELTRDLAERFNHFYGETFTIPTPVNPKVGAKIMSLTNPSKKMSKSYSDPKGTIDLLDDPKIAYKKVMSAVTDSIGIVNFDEINQPGISNLLTILSSLTDEPIESIVQRYQNQGYASFKKEVAEAVQSFLTSLQQKYNDITNSSLIEDTLKKGSEFANKLTYKKMRKIYKKVGFDIF